MKTFHKDYTKAELKIIIKAWNKHHRIYTTGKTKSQLADELDKYFEHDENGEIQLKESEIELPNIKGMREKKLNEALAKANHPDRVKARKKKQEEREKKKKPALERKKSESEESKAEKEKSRIHSYSNTAATAALPEEMLKLIYSYLPQQVRHKVEYGTYEEQKAKFFKTKFPATKKGAEDFLSDMIDYDIHAYQDLERERVDNIVGDLASGMSEAKVDRLYHKLVEKAENQVRNYDLKEVLRLLKEGKTTEEIADLIT